MNRLAIVAIVPMVSDTTTIQVRRSTASRMSALRALGLTYDDVINFALDGLSEKEIDRLVREWQADVFAKLRPHAKRSYREP